MAHPYHIQAVIERRLGSQLFIELTNDEPDAVAVDTDVYEEERGRADAEIDAYAGARYTVPFDETPDVIGRLSIDITTHHLYARRYPEGVPAGIKATYERAVALLRQLADGTVTVGSQPAPAQNSQRTAQLTSQTRVATRDSLKVW